MFELFPQASATELRLDPEHDTTDVNPSYAAEVPDKLSARLKTWFETMHGLAAVRYYFFPDVPLDPSANAPNNEGLTQKEVQAPIHTIPTRTTPLAE